MTENKKLRTIKSFVIREGRFTEGQKQAFKKLWPLYGLELESGIINSQTTFDNDHPLVIEIGYGMGKSLLEMAKNQPETNFVGIEVHKPGVGKLLSGIDEQKLSNLKTYNHDAVEIINKCINDNSIDKFQIYFPDPWSKRKHHKRRIIQPEFLNLLKSKLKPGGIIHIATDWENYAEHIDKVLKADTDLTNLEPSEDYKKIKSLRPNTKYENRGKSLDHHIWDFVYSLKDV